MSASCYRMVNKNSFDKPCMIQGEPNDKNYVLITSFRMFKRTANEPKFTDIYILVTFFTKWLPVLSTATKLLSVVANVGFGIESSQALKGTTSI